jgi:DDE superfamily endonuclease
VQILVIGAILCPGKRTVSAVLRVMGLGEDRRYGKYHRVLSRAVWSSRKVAQQLLKHLIGTFAPTGVIVLGIDDTIERRKGKRIRAKGIDRDAVRSSDSQVVKVSGLRWLSLMLLVEIPWAKRVWALPFLTVLAPSQRYHQEQGVRHKTLSDWTRQMLKQVRRWLPERQIVAVGDSCFAVLDLLAAVSHITNPIPMVSRLRLDAALYEPALPRQPHQMGRTRLKGNRLPSLSQQLNDPTTVWQSVCLSGWYGNTDRLVEYTTGTAVWYHSGKPVVPLRWVLVRDPKAQFDPQAFLCTDVSADPADILRWFRQRWQVEVTFEEVRAHLGVETQRQWSDLAIARTTPALFGLFSLVTLFAHYLQVQRPFSLPTAAWYVKSQPTFGDALATVRRTLWATRLFPGSVEIPTDGKVPPEFLEIWCDLLCYAA